MICVTFSHWLNCAGLQCADSSESQSSMSSSDGRSAIVALGNTWSHCVNTRLIVQYVDDVTRQVFTAPFTS